MGMTPRFAELVTSAAELRALMGHPSDAVIRSRLPVLDGHCREYVARSPFVIVASAAKGDPPGFVRILDDSTLAIPERPGNRRADTFSNVLEHPNVALIFLVPGRPETLRVSGTAVIARDRWLCDEMAIGGKAPAFALVVTIRELSLHCAKCIIRSRLWDPRHWPDLEGMPTFAQAIVAQAKLDKTPAEVQAFLDNDQRERLY